jgi:hypothetical protein
LFDWAQSAVRTDSAFRSGRPYRHFFCCLGHSNLLSTSVRRIRLQGAMTTAQLGRQQYRECGHGMALLLFEQTEYGCPDDRALISIN